VQDSFSWRIHTDYLLSVPAGWPRQPLFLRACFSGYPEPWQSAATPPGAAKQVANFRLTLIIINRKSATIHAMAYKRVPEQVRECAFCGSAFTAAHRRRLYCSSSCNTRACVARKAAQAVRATTEVDLGKANSLASPASASAGTVTLAHNLQNWAILTIAPQAPKLIGAAVQFIGDLLSPREAGPSTWLPATLQQTSGPLVVIEYAEWDEPRFFVELAYGQHTLYYRAQHELLIVREATGELRQLRTAAEFAALTPKPLRGIAALQARAAGTASSPLLASVPPLRLPVAKAEATPKQGST
jgi:ribosomal protein S27AE